MPPRLFRRIGVAFVAAIALALALATLAYESVRQQIIAAGWVDHTERVELAISRTVTDFEEAESGLRGYLLTGDPAYVEPYAVAARNIPRDVEELRALTRDNPDQQARVASLARLTTDKLATMKQILALPPPSAPAEPVRSGLIGSAQTMSRIRDVTDTMTVDEERLLAIRSDRLEAARSGTKWAVGLGAMVSLLVLAVALAAIRRQVRDADMARKLLGDSERRFRLLAENASDLVRIHEIGGRVIYSSPSSDRLLGYTPEEMLVLPPYSLIHSDDRERVRAYVAGLGEFGEEAVSIKYRMLTKAGEARFFETRTQSVVEDGKVVRFHTASRDIDDEMRVTAELARSRELYRALVKHLPDTAVLLFDREMRYALVEGDEVLRFVDLSKASCEGKTLKEIASPERAARMLPSYRAALDGEETSVEVARDGRDFMVQCVPVRGATDQVVGGLVVVRDVTELREKERRLAAQADELRAMSLVDDLTKLYNRRGFLALAGQQLKVSLRNKTPLSVVFCDLNGMKKINDGLGHERGDEALVDTAAILRKTFRDSDILARLGGDEFVVLANDAAETTTERILKRLKEEIAAHNDGGGRPFRVSVSTGVASFDPKEPLSIEDLLKQADARMYENKRSRSLQPDSSRV